MSYYELIVDLDGGATTQKFATSYVKDTKLTLIAPKKAHNTFIEWKKESENVLTTGNKKTTIKVIYIGSAVPDSYFCSN